MKEAFLRGGVPPKAYQQLLTKEFGRDWLIWLPETLYSEIEGVWGVRPNDVVSNKLGAIKVFLTTDEFYHNARAFEHIVLSINDVVVNPSEMGLASPDEILYALYVLGPLNTERFEREILIYIRACCERSGLLVYPIGLRFAQPDYKNKTIQEAVKKIKPAVTEGPEDDIVTQQSNKLYACIQKVVDRISKYRPEVLEEVNG